MFVVEKNCKLRCLDGRYCEFYGNRTGRSVFVFVQMPRAIHSHVVSYLPFTV